MITTEYTLSRVFWVESMLVVVINHTQGTSISDDIGILGIKLGKCRFINVSVNTINFSEGSPGVSAMLNKGILGHVENTLFH